MVDLETGLNQAQQASLLAAEDYSQAQENKDAADRELVSANEQAAAADAALVTARENLAAVAMDAYRTGGGMNDFTAIASANGFDDVITKSEVIGRASSEADSRIQIVKAAEVVSAAMRGYAEDAADAAAEAEAAASDALDGAKQSQQQAERAVGEVQNARDAAVARLAEVRNTSVALEQQRQDGLAAERHQREIEAFEAAQKAEDAATGTATPPSTGTPRPRPTTDPKPTTTPRPDPTTDPKPDPTTDPKPTTTPKPDPTTDPEPTKDPEPPAPTPPAQSWKSSPSDGAAAVAKALTLMGSAYEWGGNGPAYDCSGVTSTAWRAAGYYIPRSSTTQYNGLTKVSSSNMRKGDLIFYGSGRSTSRIYHVAIYIGGGMVAEAATYGTPSRVRSLYAWGVSDMLPTVGRP